MKHKKKAGTDRRQQRHPPLTEQKTIKKSQKLAKPTKTSKPAKLAKNVPKCDVIKCAQNTQKHTKDRQ